MLQYLLARAEEPSSYAGLAALLSAFGVNLAPAEFHAVVGLLTAIAVALAVFLPELGKRPPPAKPDPSTSVERS